MSVFELCSHEIVSLQKSDSVLSAAKMMRQFHVGAVVVVERENDKYLPIGIVTDRDIVLGVVATELDSNVITVGDVMVPSLLVINEEASVYDAIKLMSSKGVRRLPVLRENGELVGILTLDDLLIALAKEFGSFAKLLSREQKNEFKNRR